MVKKRGGLRVLHVDDESSFGEMAAEFLEREDPRLTVRSETDPREVLDRIATEDIDCIVSDYEMPPLRGLELLERVREDYPELPFILFTGKGSEEIASEAISAGVTDYLQKGGTEMFTVLARRITNAVAKTRAEREVAATQRRFQKLIERAVDVICIVDANGRFDYLSPAAESVLGYPPDALVGDIGFDYVHSADREPVVEEFAAMVESSDYHPTIEFRFERPDGSSIWLEARGYNLLGDPDIDGIVVYARDVTARKEREAALQVERDRAAALFEQFDEPTVEVTFEADTAVVRAVNGAFEETFGMAESSLVDQALDDAIVSDVDRETARAINRRAKRGEVVERELQRMTPDGPRTFLFRSIPFDVRDERRAYGIYVDVTERERQRAQFQAFIQRSTDVISVLNPDGTYQYQSPSVKRILGYDRGDLIGESPFDYIHPDDCEEVMAEFEEAAADPEATPTFRFRFRHQDGSWRWLEAIGTNLFDDPAVEGFVVNSRDITERKDREKVLETLHTATRDLMAAETKQEVAEIASQTAADILDFPVNGVHLYEEQEEGLVPVAASPGNREIIGDPPIVHPGNGLAWRVYETGKAQFYADVREASNIYNPETPIRSEFQLPLGEHGVFMVSSTAVGDFDDGDVTFARMLAANVEAALDRADREEEITRQYREVQRQNERLNNFADIVSHDMRNPLNVASGRLELARAECDSDDLAVVDDALDRMSQLIERTLELARQGRTVGETDSVDLRSLVERCWRTIETASAELAVADDLELTADGERLQQLFENLFRNAVEHGGDDVTIVVGALENKSGFYVEDDGPGIHETEHDAVFEPGYTTNDDGTGFGLAIVKEIVEAHGWSVDVTESGDTGTRFDITGVEPSR